MKNLTYSEKIRLFILFCLILTIIAFVGYTIYNNFIKIAPVEKLDDVIVYNDIRYKFLYSDFERSDYETDKCLGRLKDNSYVQVYIVKNDTNNNYLIMEGVLARWLYVKESMYEQHKLTHIINENGE